MTSAEHKLLITSFIVSFAIHVGIITFIFAGEKQSTEKKITWVKLTSYSIPKGIHKRNGIDRHQGERNKLKSEGKEKKKVSSVKAKSEKNGKRKTEREKDRKPNLSERKDKIKKKGIKKTKKRHRTKKKVKAKRKVKKERKYSRRATKKGRARREEGGRKTKAKSKKAHSKGKSVSQARGSSPSKEEIAKIEKEISSLVRSYGGAGGAEGDSALLEAYQKVKVVYAEMVKSLVEENFKIPQTMKQKKLSCIVYIKIGEDGEIQHIKIEKSSGDTRYDLFVLKTVRESAPFPPPPSGSEIELYLRFVNMK